MFPVGFYTNFLSILLSIRMFMYISYDTYDNLFFSNFKIKTYVIIYHVSQIKQIILTNKNVSSKLMHQRIGWGK
jgi:hypothetical protein